MFRSIFTLQSVITKYRDGVNISVSVRQITFSCKCTIVRCDKKEWPQLTVVDTWKVFRIQTSYSTTVLREACISLLLCFKHRSSTFVDKRSVNCARPAHISVHLHLHCHRMGFGLRATDCVCTARDGLGPDRAVGIATGYGGDGPGNESRLVEIFHIRADRPWCPPSPLWEGVLISP